MTNDGFWMGRMKMEKWFPIRISDMDFKPAHYADKSSREFYQIGMSSNASGISIYLMTIKDKTYLQERYGASIGKAKVTGYCIRFKTIKDIHLEVLEAAIQDGIK